MGKSAKDRVIINQSIELANLQVTVEQLKDKLNKESEFNETLYNNNNKLNKIIDELEEANNEFRPFD